MRPRSGVSYTSRSWNGVWRRSTSVPSKYTPLPAVSRSKIFSDTSPALGHPLLERKVAAAHDALDHHVAGLERLDEVRIDGLGLVRVVGREIADVDVERGAGALRPRMDREVGLGEHDGPRGAPVLAAIEAVELVEMVSEDGKAYVGAGIDAEVAELAGRVQQLALLAVVEVGNDVQSLHFDTPFQAKVREKWDCVRDLGRSAMAGRPQTQGGGCSPSPCRGLPKRKISR